MVNTTIFKILFVVHFSLFTLHPHTQLRVFTGFTYRCSLLGLGQKYKKKIYIGEWRGVFFEVFFY